MDFSACRLTVPIEVRFSDLDALGHVNNATYFVYYEIARVAYLRAVTGKPVTLEDIKLVIVDAACRYRSPALLGEVLAVGIRVSAMRRSSFAFEYGIREQSGGRLVAEGRTVQTVFDHHRQRVMPIGADFRAQVERFEGQAFNPQAPIPPWTR
jgi:acyl-CoA thioester hydrolase